MTPPLAKLTDRISNLIEQLNQLLAQANLDNQGSNELRYRIRQLELAHKDLLGGGPGREEAYHLLCKALLSLTEEGYLAPAGAALAPGQTPARRSVPLTPDILEWARQQFSEEEIVAGIQEVRQTGGVELSAFIHQLEEEAGADERRS